jgi:hypothetical protein
VPLLLGIPPFVAKGASPTRPAGSSPARPESSAVTERQNPSVVERVATVSWKADVVTTFVFGALLGMVVGQREGSATAVLAWGVTLSLVSGAMSLAMHRAMMARLKPLGAADRRIVIDAVRFGRPVDEPRLFPALLNYGAAKRRKSATGPIVAAWAISALMSLVYVVLPSSHRDPFTAVFCAFYGVASAAMAAIMPGATRIQRQNADSATLAARTAAQADFPLPVSV